MTKYVPLIALLLAPLPAFAQTDTGTRLGGHPAQVPGKGSMPDTARARVWLENYAACLIKRDPTRIAHILDAPVAGNENIMRGISVGNFDSCLSGGGEADMLRMSTALLRGALYADRVDHLVRDVRADSVARPLEIAPGADPLRTATVRFGECVMRQNPAAALDFVRSKAATEGENKALAAIKPALPACVDSGPSVTLTRASIKAATAEAIYRATQPAAGAQTAGKN